MDFADLMLQIILWHSGEKLEILVQGAKSHIDKLVKRNSNRIHTFIYTCVCVYHFDEKLIIFINFNIQKLPTLQSICTPKKKAPIFYYNFFECHHSLTLNLICFVFSFLFLFNILSLIKTLTNNFKLNNNNNEKLSPK